MNTTDQLAYQQLHEDLQETKAAFVQGLKDLAELIVAKEYVAKLPEVVKTKAEGTTQVEGKAVITGDVKVVNLDELEQYFMSLQFAMLAEASNTHDVNVTNPVTEVAVSNLDTVVKVLRELKEQEVKVTVDQKAASLTPHTKASQALAVRLVDKTGRTFYDAISSGGGGGSSNLRGQLSTGTMVDLMAVELVDSPGHYGMVVANPDGTSIGTGGGTSTAYRIVDNGDIRVTDTGDVRVYA